MGCKLCCGKSMSDENGTEDAPLNMKEEATDTVQQNIAPSKNKKQKPSSSVHHWNSLDVENALDILLSDDGTADAACPKPGGLFNEQSALSTYIEPDHILTGSQIDSIFSPVDERILGRGVSCVVGEVMYIGDLYPTKAGNKYALKRMDRNKGWIGGKFKKEVHILKKVRHTSVVSLDDVYMDEDYYYICTELCTGGALLDRITKNRSFSEQNAAHIVKQLYKTLAFAHKNDIVHRDIKPANIVFDKPGDLAKPVIIDFGDALEMTDDGNYKETVGTLAYLPPESMTQNRTGFQLKQGDIWSLGITCYIMLTGTLPFGQVRTEHDVIAVIQKWRDNYLDFPDDVDLSESCKDFMCGVLRASPKIRFTAEQAVGHPWLRDITSLNSNSLGEGVIGQIAAFHQAEMLKKIFVQGFISQMNEEQQLWVANLFYDLDTSGKGHVNRGDVSEWLAGSGFGGNATDKRTDEIFELLDYDKDGEITYGEFIQGYASMRLSRAPTTDVIGVVGATVDGNQQIDLAEVVNSVGLEDREADTARSLGLGLDLDISSAGASDGDGHHRRTSTKVDVKTVMSALRSPGGKTGPMSMKDLFALAPLNSKRTQSDILEMLDDISDDQDPTDV